MKKCPYCAEEIQDEAIKCKHCNEWLKKEAAPKVAPRPKQTAPPPVAHKEQPIAAKQAPIPESSKPSPLLPGRKYKCPVCHKEVEPVSRASERMPHCPNCGYHGFGFISGESGKLENSSRRLENSENPSEKESEEPWPFAWAKILLSILALVLVICCWQAVTLFRKDSHAESGYNRDADRERSTAIIQTGNTEVLHVSNPVTNDSNRFTVLKQICAARMDGIRPAMLKYWTALSKANQMKWPSRNAISDPVFRHELRQAAGRLSSAAYGAKSAYMGYVQRVCADIEQTSMSQPTKASLQQLIREKRYDLAQMFEVNIQTSQNILELCSMFDSPSLKCKFKNNEYLFDNPNDADHYALIYKNLSSLADKETLIMKDLKENIENYKNVTGVNLLYRVEPAK